MCCFSFITYFMIILYILNINLQRGAQRCRSCWVSWWTRGRGGCGRGSTGLSCGIPHSWPCPTWGGYLTGCRRPHCVTCSCHPRTGPWTRWWQCSCREPSCCPTYMSDIFFNLKANIHTYCCLKGVQFWTQKLNFQNIELWRKHIRNVNVHSTVHSF